MHTVLIEPKCCYCYYYDFICLNVHSITFRVKRRMYWYYNDVMVYALFCFVFYFFMILRFWITKVFYNNIIWCITCNTYHLLMLYFKCKERLSKI